MKEWIVDASVIIAVLMREPERDALLEITRDATLFAPASLHWEVGNALSAMFKRKRITVHQANELLGLYRRIALRLVDVSMEKVLAVACEHDMYAYDAYFLVCAMEKGKSLLTLDRNLQNIARKMNISLVEIAA